MTGRLIAIVGPSGVGKDSVMEGLVSTYPGYICARRVITRAPEAGGEDYDPVTEAEFHRMVAAGEFALHWPAHGLFYGIPHKAHDDLNRGQNVLINLSRKVLTQAMSVFPTLQVILLTARPAILAQRLAGRGRETAEQIEKRLAQADLQIPDGVPYLTVLNEGRIEDTLQTLHTALHPERLTRCS